MSPNFTSWSLESPVFKRTYSNPLEMILLFSGIEDFCNIISTCQKDYYKFEIITGKQYSCSYSISATEKHVQANTDIKIQSLCLTRN